MKRGRKCFQSVDSYLQKLEPLYREREKVRSTIEEHKKELRKLTRKINILETCIARFREGVKWGC